MAALALAEVAAAGVVELELAELAATSIMVVLLLALIRELEAEEAEALAILAELVALLVEVAGAFLTSLLALLFPMQSVLEALQEHSQAPTVYLAELAVVGLSLWLMSERLNGPNQAASTNQLCSRAFDQS